MPKLIQITESDLEYRKGLVEILMGEGASPTVFEVPDAFDVNSYEGLALYVPKTAAPDFQVKYPEVAAWLPWRRSRS